MVKIVSDMGAAEISVKGSLVQVTTEAVTGFMALVRALPEAKRLKFLDRYFEVLYMYKEYLIADDDEADDILADVQSQITDMISDNAD